MVAIGGVVKDFELDAFHEEVFKKVKLSAYRGKWLVLFFYPADFSFVCPTELEELADNYKEFSIMGAEILAVSTDTMYVHKAWHDESKSIAKITYPMVADPSGKLSREFGVYLEDEGLSLRGTFLIDPDGVLKTIEVHDNNIGRSAKELLRKLSAAKFVRANKGMVCPANWSTGKPAIKAGIDLVGKI
ncbi:MAG: redoxin domain-containing protein [archaeon]